MEEKLGELVNMGIGKDCTISELSETINEIGGYKSKLIFDTAKINYLVLKAKTSLKDGLMKAHEYFSDKCEYKEVE